MFNNRFVNLVLMSFNLFFKKNPKKPKNGSKKKPGFNEDIYKETEYFIKDGASNLTVHVQFITRCGSKGV